MRRTALCSMRFALAVGVAWGVSLGAAHAEPDDKPALVRDAEAKAKAGAAKAGQKAQPTVGEQVHAQDAETGSGDKIDTWQRRIRLTGDLDAEQRQRLLEIADRCPVHRTLERTSRVVTQLVD